MEAIYSGYPDCVHGATRVLTEFSRELTDVNISKVTTNNLPNSLLYSWRLVNTAKMITNIMLYYTSCLNDSMYFLLPACLLC